MESLRLYLSGIYIVDDSSKNEVGIKIDLQFSHKWYCIVMAMI